MVVNIEGSEYKGEQCMFVTISTGFNRDRSHGSQNFCQVSGFVNFELVTLEERRLITTKLYTTENKEYDSSKPTTASSEYCSNSEAEKNASEIENNGIPTPSSYSEQKKSKRILQEFQTCRSILLDETQDDTRRFIKVAEWQRSNGKLVVQKNFGREGFPSCQTYHQLELPQNSAFLTDISLLLAEKLMARTMKTGKFDKISTLDKRCLFAPLCLESRRDVKDNFSGEIVKILKSSPVDKGATETSYSIEGYIRDRTIITAKKLRYHLKNVNNNTSSSGLSSSSDEDNNSNNYKKVATNQFFKDMRFSDRFFAENLHDTINRNLAILRQRMFEENLRRNLVKMYTVISGQSFNRIPPVKTIQVDPQTPIKDDNLLDNEICTKNTEVELRTGNPKRELAAALKFNSSDNTDSIVFLIKTALCEVLLHKPDEPLVYLRQYFKDLREKNELKKNINPNKNRAMNDAASNSQRKKEFKRSKSDAIVSNIGNKMVRTSRPYSSSDIISIKQ